MSVPPQTISLFKYKKVAKKGFTLMQKAVPRQATLVGNICET
jgi:hypothetical protein